MTRARPSNRQLPVQSGRGRDTYSAEAAIAVCDRIAAGDTLARISKEPGMPASTTVWYWTRDNPEFRAMHAQAREVQALGWVDALLELARECPADPAAVAKARLEIDTLKWIIAKHLPKLYGDRPDPFTPAAENQPDAGQWWRALNLDEMRELRDANEAILRLRAMALARAGEDDRG